ncbi:MAG: sensor histidine kinase, partial [Bacteroidota bacterium]
LRGNSLEENDYLAAIQEHLKAITVLRGLKDYVSIRVSWYQITLIYYRNGDLAEALTYNDSSIVACYQALEARREETPILSQAYQIRGRTFTRLGQLDSALHYSRRGFSEEIRLLRRQEQNRIFEISEQYKDEAKTRRIEEQARLLRSERLRTSSLIIITILILLLSGVLAYFYFRVRQSNQVNASQAQLLSITNSELATSLDHQKMLQSEVHHRVKNNLQVLVSLLELQKQDIKNEATRGQLEAISGRIYSMAALHDMLHQQDGNQTVNFLDYTKKLCTHLSSASIENPPIFHYDIPPKHFNLETLMPLGILLNELLTNSFKYAQKPDKSMEIELTLRPQEDGFLLYYRDNGPGFPSGVLQDRQGGLGAFLLRSMSRQLKGSITTENNNGATYSIFFREKVSPL